MPEAPIMTPEMFENLPLDAEYELQILAPPDIPAHYIRFDTGGEALTGRHTNEHESQEMVDLARSGDHICWRAKAGSHGDELFQFEMRLFMGGVMVGTARRCDIGGFQPESPVVCRAKK